MNRSGTTDHAGGPRPPGAPLGAAGLLQLIGALEPGVLIADLGRRRSLAVGRLAGGQHAARGQVDGHLAGTASLLGLHAPPGSQGVAVGLLGRTGEVRHGADRSTQRRSGEPADEVRIDVAVDVASHRIGRVRAVVAGRPGGVVAEDRSATGLVVDALHRVLGLRSPGAPPPFRTLVLSVWCVALLDAVRDPEALTWDRAAALHPAAPLHPATSRRLLPAPSPDAIAARTRATDGPTRWESLRRLVASGTGTAGNSTGTAGNSTGTALGLRPGDAEWMDATMFGRWCLRSLPTPEWTAGELRANGCPALNGFLEVCRRCR